MLREDGSLYALDARTGERLWRAPGTYNRVRPAVANGIVWAGDDQGRIVAYDARDGRRLWESPRFEPDGPGSPVIAGATLLFGTTDRGLMAYRVPS